MKSYSYRRAHTTDLIRDKIQDLIKDGDYKSLYPNDVDGGEIYLVSLFNTDYLVKGDDVYEREEN
jgi:hypothetical protein